MIDEQSSTQTSRTNDLIFTANITKNISSIALINMQAEQVRIFATNGGAETIYDKTIFLDSAQISSVYDWFYEPFTQKADHVEVDFPETYGNPVITITLSMPGSQAKIGRFVCAKTYEIGALQYGATLGIRDYSIKTTDANNVVSLTKKDNVKLMSFKLVINQGETNRINTLLRSLLSVPCVFMGHDDTTYEHTIAHGFYQNFRVILSLPTVNYCELDIEELT
jgi:hypothetical protein